MGGCWVCNPFCGQCKPPVVRLQCPACGKYYFPEITYEKMCKKCGSDLPEYVARPAVWCAFIEQMCAKPCERHQVSPEDGGVRPCAFHTLPRTDAEQKNQ